MCQHNEEEYDCLDCCFESGKQDKLNNEPYDNFYKNWDQCNAYKDGWGHNEY